MKWFCKSELPPLYCYWSSPKERVRCCCLVEEWMNLNFSQHIFINPLHIPESVPSKKKNKEVNVINELSCLLASNCPFYKRKN